MLKPLSFPALSISLVLLGGGLIPASLPAATLYGLTSNNRLVSFDSANPGAATSTLITGLSAFHSVRGIDFRPANGVLYGISRDPNNSDAPAELVTIDPLTAVASLVASLGIGVAQNGIAFDPVADQLVVYEYGTPNRMYRINPNGTVASAVNQSITYAPGDPNSGSPQVEGIAFTNNFAGGSATAQMLAIDCSASLMVVDPSNGQANTIGSLGSATGCQNPDGFAIQGFGLGGLAWAVLNRVTDDLYSIDLQTGAATLIGDVGTTNGFRIMSLAVAPEGSFAAVPEPGTMALVGAGVAALAAVRRSRRT